MLLLPAYLCFGSRDGLSGSVDKMQSDSNYALLRRTYCERIIADTVNASFKEKVSAYDSLMTWSLAGGDSVAYYRYLFGKGETLKEQGNIHASYNHYKRLLYELDMKDSLSSSLDSIRRKVSFEIPTFLLRFNRIDESIDFAVNLLKVYPDMTNGEKIKYYNAMAMAYMRDNQEKCKFYIDKLLAIENLKHDEQVTVDNVYSGFLFYEGKLDSAIYYLEQAISLVGNSNKGFNKYYMYMNYVHICLHMGDKHMAMAYLNKVLDNMSPESGSYLRSLALADMAGVYFVSNDLNKALSLFYEAADYSSKIGDLRIAYLSKLYISEIMKKQERYEEGMKYITEAYMLKDSLSRMENEDHVYWLSKGFELYRYKADKLLDGSMTESKRLSEKYKSITTLFVVFSIFILLFVIIWVATNKLKIYKTKSEQVCKELESHQQKSRHEILQKDDRIMTGMLQGLKKNDALKDIRERLDRLKNAGDEKERNIILSELYDILKDCEIHEDMNTEVRLQFEVSHPHFSERIKEECPQLTDKEIYVCTLLASGMSAKEIARLNNYSIRSIETIIYRLRKKLQLSADVKTQEYLHRFCE